MEKNKGDSMEKKQYLVVEFEWIKNQSYREVMCSCKGIEMVYNILRRYVVRDNMDHKVSQYIYENYYNKNILASSVTFKHLSKLTNLGTALIDKCVDKLEEVGYIKKGSCSCDHGEKQNIYLLGKRKPFINEEGLPEARDFWLIDDVVAKEIYKKTLEELIDN